MSSFLLTVCLIPLLTVPVWLAAGVYPSWQEPLIPFTALAWLGFFLAPGNAAFPRLPRRIKNLVSDPFAWTALLFTGFLWLQMWNSGRISTYDFDAGKYIYADPPYPFLPWAFNALEASEMFQWFVPVLSLLVILRHGRHIVNFKFLAAVICLNGLANAGLAWWHHHHNWFLMYNRYYFGRAVFGTFGYPNHGASSFMMMLALSFGLAGRSRKRWGKGFWFLCSGFFLATLFLSRSRAGIAGGLGLCMLAFSLHLLIKHPIDIKKFRRKKLAGVFGSILAGMVLIFTVLPAQHQNRLGHKINDIPGNMLSRIHQNQAAVRMWADHPFYGVGGWGYRYLVAYYKPPEQWSMRSIGHWYEPGREANVHNDFFQFLAEFGLLGFGLLLASFYPVIKRIRRDFLPLLKAPGWFRPLRRGALLGAGMVGLHSMVDLPFRSPALFTQTVFLLSLAAYSDSWMRYSRRTVKH